MDRDNKTGTTGPRAIGLGLGVHTSTYPLRSGGALTSFQTKTSEGGPGSGRTSISSAGQLRPKIIAHWDYEGDRYKAGLRIPKSDMPTKQPNYMNKTKKEADTSSSFPSQLRGKKNAK